MSGENQFKFDFCVSFAGEQRTYVEKFVRSAQGRGARVFYDNDLKHELWGIDLAEFLNQVYRDDCLYCVMFISEDYKEKLWTNHEKSAAAARNFKSKGGYILPVRVDDTEIDAILETTGYIDSRTHTPAELAEIIIKKIPRLESMRTLDLTHEGLEAVSISVEAKPIYRESDVLFSSGNDLDSDYQELQNALSVFSKSLDEYQRRSPNSTYPVKKIMSTMADSLRMFSDKHPEYFNARQLEKALDLLEKTSRIGYVANIVSLAEEAQDYLKSYMRI